MPGGSTKGTPECAFTEMIESESKFYFFAHRRCHPRYALLLAPTTTLLYFQQRLSNCVFSI